MEYVDIDKAISTAGLRIILVQGFPSPWGQAAKAMMEHKGLDYVVGPQQAGGPNPEIVAWSGVNSAPVVAWNNEKPINRWDDILLLLERLAPDKPLVPQRGSERVQLFGLSHEICGELGFGWNRRLDMFRPAMESGEAPEGVVSMSNKYGYNETDAALANQRTIALLELLTEKLTAQKDKGSDYLIGTQVTAADFYWAAFSNLVVIQPPEECPLDPGVRPMFENTPADVAAAVDPILIEHRNKIMQAHFKIPMEL
ncbi:MAG: hypothetical protein O7G83_15580 [Proteobacteria bacterium]|nr:hypothetical protein [Pseudomonadota bacterium]